MSTVMDRILCGFSKETIALVVGAVHTVIFFGFFLLNLAQSVAMVIEHGSNNYFILWMIVNDLITSEVLMGCVFSVCLVCGIKKKYPGLILAWILSEVVIIFCSLLTILYFTAAPYLRITVTQAFLEGLINTVLAACLYVVYSYFVEIRKGNLISEEAQ